ncbi:hypothetical protein CANINC_004787 [Pichia inconspicua]|uniref:Uncharacterized protein n=1 Tax=Pichia inconspicua TaxID=52247 RepID=A0A4T0WWN7_9ASCO|nr:hypothetical protein CANINC_004787 [[Candida] inconspicua]
MDAFANLINSLPQKVVDTVKSNVLNILFSKGELLVHLLEHEDDGKHFQLHDLLIRTDEKPQIAIDDGRDRSLNLVFLGHEFRESFLRLLEKRIISIKILTMSHILKDLEYLVEFTQYVVLEDPHSCTFETKSLKYHKYIDEITITADSMNEVDIFDKFPNQNKTINIEIDPKISYEEILRIFENSKSSSYKVKFQIETQIISMYGRFNDRELSVHKRVKEYLKKQRGFNYTFRAKLSINVDEKFVNFDLLNKYIDPKEITDLGIMSFSGGNHKIPDVRRFTNVEKLDYLVSNDDFDLSKFKKLTSLCINELEDFETINNSMPKSLKEIIIRNEGDINKVPIKIPSTVETLIIESNTERNFTFRSIDLTESQVYNIMLFKSFEDDSEDHDPHGIFGHFLGFLQPPEKIKKLDHLPETVKYFTINAGLSMLPKPFEIEPTLLVNFFGVYTNIYVETEIGSLRPDLHSAKLSTGRCTNHTSGCC